MVGNAGRRVLRIAKKVSATNGEQRSAAYGLLNLYGQYAFANSGISISAGVENVPDKTYRQHLNGINRVARSDVAVGERIPGDGINAFVQAEWAFRHLAGAGQRPEPSAGVGQAISLKRQRNCLISDCVKQPESKTRRVEEIHGSAKHSERKIRQVTFSPGGPDQVLLAKSLFDARIPRRN